MTHRPTTLERAYELAREGRLDPVVGRQNEIERVMQILCRRTKNNPCLIGEPGVGKTGKFAVGRNLVRRKMIVIIDHRHVFRVVKI